MEIFQCLKQGFRIRIIVADRWPTKRRHYTELLQGCQYGGSFHWAAVVGMQDDLIWLNPFTMALVTQHFASQGTIFLLIYLPAHDHSAKNI